MLYVLRAPAHCFSRPECAERGQSFAPRQLSGDGQGFFSAPLCPRRRFYVKLHAGMLVALGHRRDATLRACCAALLATVLAACSGSIEPVGGSRATGDGTSGA